MAYGAARQHVEPPRGRWAQTEGQVPKYIVNFGSVKTMVGDRETYLKVGDEIELPATDPLVVNKHQVMTVDKEGQPVPVDPPRSEPQVVTPEQWAAIQKAKEALEAARVAMSESQVALTEAPETRDETETPQAKPPLSPHSGPAPTAPPAEGNPSTHGHQATPASAPSSGNARSGSNPK